MVDNEEEAFRYISYATPKEVWAETKSLVLSWLILSIVCIAFGALFEAGADATRSLWSDVPKPILYFLGFAAISWFMRGQTFHFVFPKTFRIWLLSVVVVGTVVVGAAILPTWAMIPIYFGVVLFVSLLDELSRIGKENYERLNPREHDLDDDDFDEA